MYETILAPLDSSDFSEEALSMAASIARRADAELCLATVEFEPAFFPEGYQAAVARKAAEDYLEQVAARLREALGLETSTQVLTGDIVESLETLRAELPADIVVMATHGRGPASRTWLGSTADSFLRTTDAPLLLIRPRGEGGQVDLGKEVDIRRILITSDGSPTSEAVLEPAIALGQLFNASYHVLRLVEFPHGLPSVYLPDVAADNRAYLDSATAVAERETEQLVERMRTRGLNVESSVEVGVHVAEGILSTAAEGDFDLIAIATHGRGGVRRMVLGSVADKVIRGAQTPVLTVRPRTD